jgi:5-methylcytosine-specific restriction endonuclease McrA
VTCRQQAITIDHVVPRSKGGKTSWTNVVAACHNCNRKKGNRSPERAGMKLLTEPRRPTWRDLIEDPTREGEADWLPYLASRAFSETG